MNKPDSNGLESSGSVIRAIRGDRGLTQAELARKLNWDRSRLNRVERGTTKVTRTMIHEFAEAFEIQPVILLLRCLKEEYPSLQKSRVAKQLDKLIEDLK